MTLAVPEVAGVELVAGVGRLVLAVRERRDADLAPRDGREGHAGATAEGGGLERPRLDVAGVAHRLGGDGVVFGLDLAFGEGLNARDDGDADDDDAEDEEEELLLSHERKPVGREGERLPVVEASRVRNEGRWL